MDITVVKFLILWVMCQNIGLTTSKPLKEIASTDTRPKRSPADNFSLFGFRLGSPLSNPITKTKESLSSIGNIFSANRGNIQKYHQPIDHYDIVKNINKYPQIDVSNRSGIPKPTTQDGLQKEDKNNRQQEDQNESHIKLVSENKQILSDKSNIQPELAALPETKDETLDNKTDNQNSEKESDKQLLAYIFQMTPYDENGSMTTTIDPIIDYTTETGDYENTTIEELLRIPAPVVASLLG